jgi:hypothetical protein
LQEVHKMNISNLLNSFKNGEYVDEFNSLGLNEDKINNLSEEEARDIIKKLCSGKRNLVENNKIYNYGVY